VANKSLQTDRGRITVFGVYRFLSGPGSFSLSFSGGGNTSPRAMNSMTLASSSTSLIKPRFPIIVSLAL